LRPPPWRGGIWGLGANYPSIPINWGKIEGGKVKGQENSNLLKKPLPSETKPNFNE